MTTRFAMFSLFRRIASAALAIAIGLAIVTTLRSHGQRLLDAVAAMDGRWMALAFAFCLFYRVVNAFGWTLVLRALGQPMDAGPGVRIWLVSEACRWLPGSLWSYGSRGVLAARAGVPPVTAAVSLAWELILTVLAWVIVAVPARSKDTA